MNEKISDWIAHFVGSWKFIFIFSSLLLTWIILNTHYLSFDIYPFILLNLVLSFIAAFQAPFIMMSQNRAEKKQDEAYRILFHELKELVKQDLEYELEIETLEKEIKIELEIVKNQQLKLLQNLQKVISLDEFNKKTLVEILKEHYDN